MNFEVTLDCSLQGPAIPFHLAVGLRMEHCRELILDVQDHTDTLDELGAEILGVIGQLFLWSTIIHDTFVREDLSYLKCPH